MQPTVSVQFSSVQSLSRVRLRDPMNRSTPGLPVHHHLPEFTQTHKIVQKKNCSAKQIPLSQHVSVLYFFLLLASGGRVGVLAPWRAANPWSFLSLLLCGECQMWNLSSCFQKTVLILGVEELDYILYFRKTCDILSFRVAPRRVDLPGPGIEPASPAWAGRFLSTAPPGESLIFN